jgi:hypothetical protein
MRSLSKQWACWLGWQRPFDLGFPASCGQVKKRGAIGVDMNDQLNQEFV